MGRRRALIAAALAFAACKSESKPAENRAPESVRDAAATADPPKRPTLEKPTEAFKQALRQGRELVRAGKYSEALVELDKALAISPENARVHSEVSLAALLAGDLERAKKAATLSITLALDPGLKAASYYNLGAAREKAGDRAAAIEAYTKSLELRPHEGVEKKLVALGGVPPARSALQVTRFDGPVSGPEALCESKDECFVHDLARASGLGRFAVAAAVRLDNSEKPPQGWTYGTNCHAVVQTARGWFVARNALACDEYDVTRVAIASEGELLAIRFGSYRSSRTTGLYEDWLMLCGVGPSTVPACTEPIETGYEMITNDDETGDESREESDYKISLDGAVLEIGDGEHRGRHQLAFP